MIVKAENDEKFLIALRRFKATVGETNLNSIEKWLELEIKKLDPVDAISLPTYSDNGFYEPIVGFFELDRSQPRIKTAKNSRLITIGVQHTYGRGEEEREYIEVGIKIKVQKSAGQIYIDADCYSASYFSNVLKRLADDLHYSYDVRSLQYFAYDDNWGEYMITTPDAGWSQSENETEFEIQPSEAVRKEMEKIKELSREGLTITQISLETGLSVSTIKRYRKKMGIRKRRS